MQIGFINISCTPDCGLGSIFEKMASGLKKMYNKMTGRDNEDGSSDGRKVWEFEEDVVLVKSFILNPGLKKKKIFEIVSENTR